MKDSLSNTDIKQWMGDTIIFNFLPVVLVFLTTLQTGNFSVALGASYTALIAALINLVQKYKSGLEDPGDMSKATPSVPVTPVAPVVPESSKPIVV